MRLRTEIEIAEMRGLLPAVTHTYISHNLNPLIISVRALYGLPHHTVPMESLRQSLNITMKYQYTLACMNVRTMQALTRFTNPVANCMCNSPV